MSGIVGMFNLDSRPVDPTDVRVMTRIIAHRGPDGIGAWIDGPVGLGHCLLRTTPDAIPQPLVHPSGQFAITADVRLDNRKELGDQLGMQVNDESPSDAELILEAYLKWGEDCPVHLLGDFAFAIWDGRNRSLFCARDHAGVRPFTYSHRPGTLFAFGSEVKSVLAAPGVPFQINEARIADYLSLTLYNPEDTFFQGVRRLPPGHWLRVSAASCTVRCYWSPDPSYELRLADDREYVEGFREVFNEAVDCRLRSTTPIASQLSGGLDSSFVTSVASDLLRDRHPGAVLHTISCIYDEYPECDERHFAQAVLDRCQVAESLYVHPDQVSPLAYLEDAQWREDGPSLVHNEVMNQDMARCAAAAGTRVMLDGADGDTIVSHGEERMHELAFSGDWATFTHEASELAKMHACSPDRVFQVYAGSVLSELARTRQWGTWLRLVRGAASETGVGSWQLFRSYGLSHAIPGTARRTWRTLSGRKNGVRLSLLHPDLIRRTGYAFHSATAQRPERSARLTHHGYLIRGSHAYCNEAADRVGAWFGVEVRHPFFDRRMMEYCLSLPADQKLRDGWSRSIARRAMEGIVPPDVQWRREKSNLSSNFRMGLWRFERDRIAWLGANVALLDGFVNQGVLSEAIQRFLVKPVKRDADNLLWPALNLAAWLPGLEGRYRATICKLQKEQELGIAG